ncbi:MAG: hypothetical protein QOG35_1568 [Solirubrobacteraceae bacterium]|jgi:uncharacterized protein (DUF1697 family)|nr:hypothetical protein [Solirubrobacteraceae bacterium]
MAERGTQVVALLRGINVGRHKRVRMADLRTLLQDAGYRDVRTHLQSGNVVATAPIAAAKVAPAMRDLIAGALGLTVDVVVRTASELAAIVDADPLGKADADGSKHLVVFLSDAPDPDAVARLEAEDFGPERWAVRGLEVYVWYPGGFRDSPLGKALSARPLAPIATARNWNTVTRVLEIAREG